MRRLKPWFLAFFGFAVLLSTLAGCSYEATIHTGTKPPETRPLQPIFNDVVGAFSELEMLIGNIRDADSAKAAVPKINEIYGRVLSLYNKDVKDAEANSTSDQDQQAMTQFRDRMTEAIRSLTETITQLHTRVPVLPQELDKAIQDGLRAVQGAQAAEKNRSVAPVVAGEFLADSIPENSCWVVWLLCVIILAVCVGFLFATACGATPSGWSTWSLPDCWR